VTNVNSAFKSFLVKNANYNGFFELPKLKTTDTLPQKLIPFSKAMCRSFTDFDCFVHFYEDDIKFERLWNNPKQYLNKLKMMFQIQKNQQIYAISKMGQKCILIKMKMENLM